MPVNRYQHLGSSQAPLTPADGTLIEGPPTADITLIPKNLGRSLQQKLLCSIYMV